MQMPFQSKEVALKGLAWIFHKFSPIAWDKYKFIFCAIVGNINESWHPLL